MRIAILALARKLAQLVYRVMRRGQDYVDAGEQAYDRQFEARPLAGLWETARSLGYSLTQGPAKTTSATG
jgi:transposase